MMADQELFKTCSKCKEPQPISAFSKSGSSGDGLKSSCKKCASKASRALREKNKNRANTITPVSKTCFGCRIEKVSSLFSKNYGNKDGLDSHCKECKAKKNRALREKNRNRSVIIVPDFKLCPGCKKEKPRSVFSKNSNSTDGLNNYCKECAARSIKLYHKKNKAREIIVIPGAKICPDCKIEKLSSSFNKANGNKDGLQVCCKSCQASLERNRQYGLSSEQYSAMLEAQGGACAICKFTPGPGDRGHDTDHIHGTKIVRGLLHSKCNRGLGHFKDDIAIIGKAIDYLNGQTLGIVYSTPFDKDIRNKILLAQGYLCKICSTDLHGKKACIDHDHLTNMVRGILCYNCNWGLGQFDDSIPILQSAIKYLEKYKTNVENVVEYTE
jgi:hypothetical protein